MRNRQTVSMSGIFWSIFGIFRCKSSKNVDFIRLTAVGHLNFSFDIKLVSHSELVAPKFIWRSGRKKVNFCLKIFFLQWSNFILCKCFEYLKQERKICWKLWSFVRISEMRFWVSGKLVLMAENLKWIGFRSDLGNQIRDHFRLFQLDSSLDYGIFHDFRLQNSLKSVKLHEVDG